MQVILHPSWIFKKERLRPTTKGKAACGGAGEQRRWRIAEQGRQAAQMLLRERRADGEREVEQEQQ